jgi:hypothetical protein
MTRATMANPLPSDVPGDSHQGIFLFDDLPVGSGNGVCEYVPVEHPDGAGKPCQRFFLAGVVDGVINRGKAFRPSRQCLASVLEIIEQLVISADICGRGY